MVYLLYRISEVRQLQYNMVPYSILAYPSISSTYDMLPVSSNSIIDRICDEETAYAIPAGLKHQLLVARFSARTNKYMANSMPLLREKARSEATSSILCLLEQEYTGLCRSLGPALTGTTFQVESIDFACLYSYFPSTIS